MTSNTLHVSVSTAGTVNLFSFDAATYKQLSGTLHQVNEDETFTSSIEVTHDGISSFEIQSSFSSTNTIADSVSTAIYDDSISLQVVPAKTPVHFTFYYDLVEVEQYGEHTLPGKWIKGVEGFAVANSRIIIREPDNNQNVDVSVYRTGSQYGQLNIGPDLFDANTLVEENGSTLLANDDFIAIASSNQPNNRHYVELDVVPGEIYQLNANALYAYSETFARESIPDQHNASSIRITDSGEEVLRQDITLEEATYALRFRPTSNTVQVSFGLSTLGVDTYLRSVSFVRVGPFYTYNQTQGTFYYTWDTVVAGSGLFTAGVNSIRVDAANNVYINSVNCGPQAATNKLAFSYDGAALVYSLNGSVPASNTGYTNNVKSLTTTKSPFVFSYTNELVSNTTLTELTNG